MHSLRLNFIRHSILSQLDAANPASLPLETVYKFLLFAGQKVSRDAVVEHLSYLKEEGHLEEIESNRTLGLTRYKITLSGLDYLAEWNFC